jgi:hypothetical protein
VRAIFTFTDKLGATIKVHDNTSFANALEQQHSDFGRVRGIANAAKHLELKNKLRVADIATEHIKVAVQEPTFSFGEHIKRFRLVCLHGGNRLHEHGFGFIPAASLLRERR